MRWSTSKKNTHTSSDNIFLLATMSWTQDHAEPQGSPSCPRLFLSLLYLLYYGHRPPPEANSACSCTTKHMPLPFSTLHLTLRLHHSLCSQSPPTSFRKMPSAHPWFSSASSLYPYTSTARRTPHPAEPIALSFPLSLIYPASVPPPCTFPSPFRTLSPSCSFLRR